MMILRASANYFPRTSLTWVSQGFALHITVSHFYDLFKYPEGFSFPVSKFDYLSIR